MIDCPSGSRRRCFDGCGIGSLRTVFLQYKSLGTDMDIQLKSVITCPECGAAREEQMPTDACQWFYECRACGVLLRPRQGDCCVFCSYGTVPCPPVQLHGKTACCGDLHEVPGAEAKEGHEANHVSDGGE